MPTPPTAPVAPRRPRLKFLLLSAAGAALILLPLGQVLRYQSAELETLAAQRAALDPLTQALGVQRSLLSHRDAADRVLRGRSTLESERRIRQADLEQRLRDLQDTLTAGWWLRALQESQSLANGWRHLARRVMLRQVSAADSLLAHELLTEQAVQVMDLVQAAAPTASGALVALSLSLLPKAQIHQSPKGREQALAGLESALQALDAQLLARRVAVQEQRAAVGMALGALLALGLAAGLRYPRRAGRLQAAQVPADTTADSALDTSGDTQRRRNHGRRATDQAPQRDESAPLLQRLRNDTARQTPETR